MAITRSSEIVNSQQPATNSKRKSLAANFPTSTTPTDAVATHFTEEEVPKTKRQKQTVTFSLPQCSVADPNVRLASEAMPDRAFSTTDANHDDDDGLQFPNAARKWTKHHLDLLGVDIPNGNLDLNSVLLQNQNDWTSEMRECVEQGTRELKLFDYNKWKTTGQTLFWDFNPWRQSDFYSVFTSFCEILNFRKQLSEQKRELRIQKTSKAENNNLSATRNCLHCQRRITYEYETSYCDGCYEYSFEYKLDRSWRNLARNFTEATLQHLGAEFLQITWQTSGHRVFLRKTREEKLCFELPKTNRGELQKYNVVAPNDNELDIMFLNDGWKFWYPNAITPVLQMQVKRRDSPKMKSIRKSDECFEASIFCQMLAQTLHPEFYQNPNSKYQEAFVILYRIRSTQIYYSKLPHQYLKDIATFGVNYASSRKYRVRLYHTKPFHLENTEERVSLFQLMANLLAYLSSGKSHVGYLFNYPENPIHQIKSVVPSPPCLTSQKATEAVDPWDSSIDSDFEEDPELCPSSDDYPNDDDDEFKEH